MSDIIRVFVRRTSMTPTDDLVVVGEPPLFKLPDLPIHVSVVFSWDIDRADELATAWAAVYGIDRVSLGGPALNNVRQTGDPDDPFVPGRYLKAGVTITSRGCPKSCPWCLVRKREGNLREINIAPGWIVQDNNLLACSRGHVERVFDMLRQQKRGIKFSGGLDIDYLQDWHVKLLKSIKVDELWVACDAEQDLARIDKAVDMLSDFSVEKKRCYVMIGFGGETPDEAERRCEAVYDKGFLPFAQFYRPSGGWRKVPDEWRFVQWKWSRPAAYRARKEATA